MVRISDTLKQQNDLTSFPVAFGDSIWLNKDKNGATEDYSDLQTMYNNDELGNGGSSIQVDTMPIASVDELGKIYEFIGSTGTYVNGYFYECVSDGEPTPTYSWVQKNVQPNAESFTFNKDDFNIDSSTDEVSLLPSRRVFNGSKADWDLLSVAEKTQYGATAFTDDEGSEISSPVDVVESGNMNAVTSNAVYGHFKKKIVTKNITVDGQDGILGSVAVIDDGYEAVMAVITNTGDNKLYVYRQNFTSQGLFYYGLQNWNSQAITVDIEITVLERKI